MLNRKLDKAGLIVLSFLFIAATPVIRSTGSNTPECKVHFSGSATHAFDSTGLCVCLPDLNNDDLAEAPRIQLNKHVEGYVSSYIKKNGFFLGKIKSKADRYFPTIETVFADHNIPAELKYLAVIESKLNPTAYSKVGAAGMWQFMPASARTFGLKVNDKTDERRNSYKSTIAAAKCLIYLNRIFDDWLLTIAAYNSGPGRVLSAIKKSGSRNFWVLQNYLPLETRLHVKKFISIHYYYEGHGSLATLTKAETQAHIKAVAGFIKKQDELKSDSTTTVTEVVTAL
jgi:membrane-bound lytic murein transglycosylase D